MGLRRGSEIQKHLKSGLYEDLISNYPVFKGSGFSYSYDCSHSNTRLFKIQNFLPGFQMVFNKMATICPDFKWLGFQIADPIQNLDHLQHNLFSMFEIQTSPDFRFLLYIALQ